MPFYLNIIAHPPRCEIEIIAYVYNSGIKIIHIRVYTYTWEINSKNRRALESYALIALKNSSYCCFT